MKKILITGSSGFIATSLIRRLSKKQFSVVGIDLIDGENTDFVVDITSDQIKSIFDKEKPDTVIHLAAEIDVQQSLIDPYKDLNVNGFGTLNILMSALKNGCNNFVYINSGGAIYQQSEKLPLPESTPVIPSSPYGLSKNLGEGYVRIFCTRQGSAWTSLALSNCFGPTNIHKKGVIFEFSNAIKNNIAPVIFGPDNTRDFIYIEDVLDAIELAIAKPINQRINISSNQQISLLELYNLIASEVNSLIKPIIEKPKFGDILKSQLDNYLAKKALGWEPKVDIKRGVSLALSWAN